MARSLRSAVFVGVERPGGVEASLSAAADVLLMVAKGLTADGGVDNTTQRAGGWHDGGCLGS